jgi:hypothetical protein
VCLFASDFVGVRNESLLVVEFYRVAELLLPKGNVSNLFNAASRELNMALSSTYGNAEIMV